MADCRKCACCGKTDDERWMHRYNSGRSAIWLCYECDRKAQSEVVSSEMRSQKRLRRTIER